MRKTVLLLALAALIVAACGTPQPVPPPAPTEASQPPSQPVQPQAPASDQPAGLADLGGKTWQWVKTEMNNDQVFEPANSADYTLEFFYADGKISARADCNQASGSFNTDGQKLVLALGPMTMAACPPGSLSDDYVKQLGEVESYFMDGQALILQLKVDSGAMRFALAGSAPSGGETKPGADLTGKVWQWTRSQDNSGQATEVTAPENYTLQFAADGSASVKADCNAVTGAYTTDGQKLTLTLGATTLAACPPNSLDAQFQKELSQVISYKLDGNNLILEWQMDSGRMTFSAAGSAAAAPKFAGRTWQWVQSLDNSGKTTAVPTPDKYTIEFTADGRAAIVTDCNGAFATYTTDQSKLDIEIHGVTMAACPPGSLSEQFLKELGEVQSFLFDGSDLILEWPVDTGAMRFKDGGPGQAAAQGDTTSSQQPTPAEGQLLGLTWQWFEATDAAGQDTPVDKPENYTVNFGADGTVAVKADCNTGSGTYAATASQLVIGPIALTRMACAPGSLDMQFVQYLQEVNTYTFNNQTLVLHRKGDAGNLDFRLGTAAAANPPVASAPSAAAPGTVAPSSDPAAAAASGLDLSGLGGQVEIKTVAATPYDNSQPPVPTGAPAHVVIVLEGEEVGHLYPIQDYMALWQQAGNDTITQIFAGFQQIMTARQNPQTPLLPPLPILPQQDGYNDLACQVKYLDFNGGSGYRFVGRTAQDATSVTNAQLRYYFQGLSADGKYYVSIRLPVAAKAIPNEPQALTTDFDKYLQDLSAQCSAAPAADFTPALDALDKIMQSINLGGTGGATPPDQPGQAGTELMGPVWKLQTIANGSTVIPVPQPENFTLQLQPDGMATLKADCNQVGASYEAKGNLIKFELGPSTMAMCPPGSLDTVYVQSIDAAAAYTVAGGQLTLTTEDGTTLTFAQ